MSGRIVEYSPPKWAKDVDSKPSEYVSLAALPTMTHTLSYDGYWVKDYTTDCSLQ